MSGSMQLREPRRRPSLYWEVRPQLNRRSHRTCQKMLRTTLERSRGWSGGAAKPKLEEDGWETHQLLCTLKEGHVQQRAIHKGRVKVGEVLAVWILNEEADTSGAVNRIAHVLWVAESARPYHIVEDRGFQEVMKTGRVHTYIPSPSTVSRDVKINFKRAQQKVKWLLQVSLFSHSHTLPVGACSLCVRFACSE